MLYWNTVDRLLRDTLVLLMNSAEFSEFRLVGGTSLSLQLGHRVSVDIDLFTDASYGSVDFDIIDQFLKNNFNYVDTSFGILQGMGRSYLVGNDANNSIKLDVYYTDDFIQPPLIMENIRMATIEEIIAMKVDVIARGGRKKDFWDIHELLNNYNISQMLALHQQRYPYNHKEEAILANFKSFDKADDFEPICLYGKHWQFVKLDIINALKI
jgi:predicted nucleotidyltransferase component of viral defense system